MSTEILQNLDDWLLFEAAWVMSAETKKAKWIHVCTDQIFPTLSACFHLILENYPNNSLSKIHPLCKKRFIIASAVKGSYGLKYITLEIRQII